MITKQQLIEQIAKGNTMREAAAELGVTFGAVAWDHTETVFPSQATAGRIALLRERWRGQTKAKPTNACNGSRRSTGRSPAWRKNAAGYGRNQHDSSAEL